MCADTMAALRPILVVQFSPTRSEKLVFQMSDTLS